LEAGQGRAMIYLGCRVEISTRGGFALSVSHAAAYRKSTILGDEFFLKIHCMKT
jgi:hypothetical protein